MLLITPWELSALQLLANGTSTTQLATRLGLAEPEIEERLAALYSRMGACTRADAINAAARRGLIQPRQATTHHHLEGLGTARYLLDGKSGAPTWTGQVRK